MRVLVTGANGFLGSNLVKKLIEHGDEVHTVVRKTSNLRRLESVKSRISIVYSALDDIDEVLSSIKNLDCLFHLAASVRLGSFKKKELFRSNVDGTIKIYKASKYYNVQRIIYISSISIFGSDLDDFVDEKDVDRGRIMSSYGESKLKSFYDFKEAYNQGLPVICVIPSNIYGPDDPNFGPLFKNYVQKHLKIIAGNLKTNMGMVHVEDVCEALILAAEKGKIGESYIINAKNISLDDLLKEAEKITGIRRPRFKVPKPFIKSAALLAEIASRIVRQQMILNRQSANLLYTTHPTFNSGKARIELGWKPRSFEATFRETLGWYMMKYGKK